MGVSIIYYDTYIIVENEIIINICSYVRLKTFIYIYM